MNIDKIINKIDNTFLFKNKENILIIEDKEQIKIVQTEYNKYDFVVSEFYIPNINNLIIAQRLARRICLNCRYSAEYTNKELVELLGVDPTKYFSEKTPRLYKGKGCEKCNFTGYKGRIAILEMIYV